MPQAPASDGAAAQAVTSAPDARAGYLVGRVDRIIRQRFAEVLIRHGLTLVQYTTLSVAQARPGLSSAQLARRSLVTAQGMNTVVTALESMGLIRRTPHQGGGRVLQVQVTAAGEAVLSACDSAIAAIEDELLSVLDPATREAMLAGLQVLAGVPAASGGRSAR